jgi:hypothetical protein
MIFSKSFHARCNDYDPTAIPASRKAVFLADTGIRSRRSADTRTRRGETMNRDSYEQRPEVPAVEEYRQLRAVCGLSPKSAEAATRGLPIGAN